MQASAHIVKESDTRAVVVSNSGVILTIKKSVEEAKQFMLNFAQFN